MVNKPAWDQYGEYLHLDKILNAQEPLSAKAGHAVHDETLFIQFHQIYELWFNQILCELDEIQKRFRNDIVDDNDMQPIILYLGRIVKILRNVENMLDILETMPPQSFVDFREFFGTASGFQSLQFRLIETRFGLLRDKRLPVFHGQFDQDLKPESKKAIQQAEEQDSLFEQLDAWLSRTPFVDFSGYNFWNEYRSAVNNMFDEKAQNVMESLSGEERDEELTAIERGREKFDSIFDKEKHKSAQKSGMWRLSWASLQAALFITVYRAEPVLQGPYKLLVHMMDIDELLARWRLRHALMVQRMVGHNMGSGGSSGYGYLMETVDKHRIFTDLFSLSTYLIPTSIHPALPESVTQEMGYNYAKKS
jgi:tryptophan 2,3-dioxygenase